MDNATRTEENAMQAEQLIETHPFAHLGRPPYRFAGLFVMPSKGLLEQNPDGYNNALRAAPCRVGSCHHCGMGLTDHYLIRDADGGLHAVGSSCVKKIRRGSEKMTRMEIEVRDAKRARDRDKRHAREEVQQAELAELMADPATQAALSELPHSRGFEDRETGRALTAWDEATWMVDHSGARGRTKTLTRIKRLLAG